MPKEALEAMAKVRAFLGELLKDAPQANKGDTR
jgi:hypothetical protein